MGGLIGSLTCRFSIGRDSAYAQVPNKLGTSITLKRILNVCSSFDHFIPTYSEGVMTPAVSASSCAPTVFGTTQIIILGLIIV